MQHWILFPILLFARLSWCVQSILFPLRKLKDMGPAKAAAETAVLAAHYAWLLFTTFTLLSPVKVRVMTPPQPRDVKLRRTTH